MESEDTDPKEEAALDALIAYTLRPDAFPPSDEEIRHFMETDPDLSPEEQEVLDRMGRELPDKVRMWQAKDKGVLVIEDERREK